MANANISIVTLSKTFDEWRVATNDLITDRNTLRNSNYVKDAGELSIADGKLLISRAAGGVTFTNDNDALIGGTITATDLVTIDDAVIGANVYLTSANSVLFANNNVQTRNLTSNSLITAANVNASGFLIVRGLTRDSQNNILNVNSTLYMSNSGAINVGNTLSANDTIIANKLTGTGLQVTANASITGNLLVSSNGIFSQNISVADTVNTLNARTTGLIVLGVANVATGNIVTANIATLNVNAAGAFANVANLRVSNSNTTNAIIDTLTVLTRATLTALNVTSANIITGNIATLNVNAPGAVANIATANISTINVTNQTVTGLLNVSTSNITSLQVGSLTVRDPIIAPSESDSSSYRLRVLQTTRGEGSFGVRLGSAANGNAWITFDTNSGNVWRLTSNSTEGVYHTILSTRNLSSSVTTTDAANAASLTAVKTAHDQATLAYTTATNAYGVANAASGATGVGFAYGQANSARDQANTATSIAINAYGAANTAGFNALNAYGTANTGRDQAGLARDQANTARNTANTALNTTRVSANSGSSLTSKQLNFVNTSTILVSVSSHPDGSNANIAFSSVSGLAGGSNKQIQYNDSGALSGAIDLVYDKVTGNLGVGSSGPPQKLTVSSSGATTIGVDSTGGLSLFRGYSIVSGGTEYSSIKQRFDSGELRITAGLSGWGGFSTFYTNGIERMQIGTSGNIRVGDSGNPATKLEVSGSHIDTKLRLYSVGDNAGQDASLDLWASEPSETYIGSGIGNNINGHPSYGRRNSILGQSYIRFVNGDILFTATPTQTTAYQVKLGSTGNFGVGSTSPSARLHVNVPTALASIPAPGSGRDLVHFASTTEGTIGNYGLIGAALNNGTYFLQSQRMDGISSAYQLLLNPNGGDVGIGTQTASTKLHINNASGGLSFVPPPGTRGGLFTSSVGDPITGGAYGLISGALTDGTYFLQAQRIDGGTATYSLLLNPNGGNVGIGTPTPTCKLDVRNIISSPTQSLKTLFQFTDLYDSGQYGQIFRMLGGPNGVNLIANYGNLSLGARSDGDAIHTPQMVFGQDGSITVGGVSIKNAAILDSGTIATARLGSGTANSVTYLAGDQTYKPLNNFLRNASAGYVGGNVFVSSSTPTAGAIGDIWIEI